MKGFGSGLKGSDGGGLVTAMETKEVEEIRESRGLFYRDQLPVSFAWSWVSWASPSR